MEFFLFQRPSNHHQEAAQGHRLLCQEGDLQHQRFGTAQSKTLYRLYQLGIRYHVGLNRPHYRVFSPLHQW